METATADPMAAELARAAELDANQADQAAAIAAGEAPPAPIDYQAEARDLVTFARSLFVPLYPGLGAIYTDDTCARIAAAAAPVLQKYGVNMGALFGKWGAELGLAFVLVPLIAPTVRAIKAPPADQEHKNGVSSNGSAPRQAPPPSSPAAELDPTSAALAAHLVPADAPKEANPLARFPGI